MNHKQRGGFVLGAVVGLLVGLALALGVALYITKAPVPFIDKVPQRTAEHDRAEAERNKQWNPNAPLGSKSGPLGAATTAPDGASSSAGVGVLPPVAGASAPPGSAAGAPGGVVPGTAADQPPSKSPATASSRDPAAILAGAPVATPPGAAASSAAPRSTAAPLEAFVYFVQTGAFTRNDDAEQQRARLSLLGLSAKITEREQAGRTVYRVRVGPFPARGEADTLVQRLQEQAIEAQIVRVERP